MTQEDIFEMLAKVYGVAWTSQAQLKDLTAFAELVAEATREHSAKMLSEEGWLMAATLVRVKK